MSYQKLIIMGRLARDPETKTTTGGTSVCEFSLAFDSGYGDHKEVVFLDVTLFGKSGEALAKYFKKGDGIHLDGRLKMDRWEDKDSGAPRTKIKMIAEKWTFPISDGEKKTDGKKAEKPHTNTSNWAQQEIDEIPF